MSSERQPRPLGHPLTLPTADARARRSADARLRIARRRFTNLALPVAGTLAFLALIELAVRRGWVLETALPRPTAIAGELAQVVQERRFWSSTGQTLKGWALGLGLAVAAAIPIGIAVGTNRWLYRSVRFLVDFVRPIPSIALLPLFILIFGIDLSLKVYIVALASFWPLFFQTVYGAQDVDPVARDTAHAYGLNRFMRFVFVSLPGATPYIATGLRISASIALLLAVGTEMVVGLPGLGFDIYRAQYAGDTTRTYALIAASGGLGMLMAIGFSQLERRTLRWHPSQRRELPL
jgi:ABC-type nitrate/sulfonate/bicarbonate transport system permease component